MAFFHPHFPFGMNAGSAAGNESLSDAASNASDPAQESSSNAPSETDASANIRSAAAQRANFLARLPQDVESHGGSSDQGPSADSSPDASAQNPVRNSLVPDISLRRREEFRRALSFLSLPPPSLISNSIVPVDSLTFPNVGGTESVDDTGTPLSPENQHGAGERLERPPLRRNNSTPIEGLPASHSAVPYDKCSDVIKAWFPQKAAVWAAFDEQPNANAFAQYLHASMEQFQIIIHSEGAEGRAARKADIDEWVKGVLDPMESSSELRAECFSEAGSRTGNCVDNKKVGWYELERIVADHQRAARDLSLTELYKESIPWARLDVLHQLAYDLAAAKDGKDESLEYLLALFGKEEIRKLIPNRKISASYDCFKVDDGEAKRIAERISRDDKDIIVHFLLTSDAWKAALRRDFPDAYLPENRPANLAAQHREVARTLDESNERLTEMMELPPDQQNSAALDDLGKEMASLQKRKEGLESQMQHAVNEQLTRRVQEKVESAAQNV